MGNSSRQLLSPTFIVKYGEVTFLSIIKRKAKVKYHQNHLKNS